MTQPMKVDLCRLYELRQYIYICIIYIFVLVVLNVNKGAGFPAQF